MEIGKPKRIYTVEPAEDPVPAPSPDEPEESPPVPAPQRVKEPVVCR
jgi:hypothetical protein